MKTIILSIAIMICFLSGKSQNELVSNQGANYNLESSQFYSQEKLKPVYFNFRRRQLKDFQKNNIQPLEFLNLCRAIKDSSVQFQIARYDSFTKDKVRLGVVALVSGFATIGLLGGASAAASSGGGQGNELITGTLASFGVVALLVIPAVAIYSSVPHQKRKAVLFRDLPVAYNQYVESHP